MDYFKNLSWVNGKARDEGYFLDRAREIDEPLSRIGAYMPEETSRIRKDKEIPEDNDYKKKSLWKWLLPGGDSQAGLGENFKGYFENFFWCTVYIVTAGMALNFFGAPAIAVIIMSEIVYAAGMIDPVIKPVINYFSPNSNKKLRKELEDSAKGDKVRDTSVLLEKNADWMTKYQNKKEYTNDPLYLLEVAVNNNNLEFVEAFMDFAEVISQKKDFLHDDVLEDCIKRAFDNAAGNKKIEIVLAIAKKDYLLTKEDKNNGLNFLLKSAVYENDKDKFIELINAGASWKTLEKDKSLIEIASLKGNIKILNEIFNVINDQKAQIDIDIDFVSKAIDNSLEIGVKNNNVAIVNELLNMDKLGKFLDVTNYTIGKKGPDLLILAVAKTSKEVVKELLKHPELFNLNGKGSNDFSAVEFANLHNKTEWLNEIKEEIEKENAKNDILVPKLARKENDILVPKLVRKENNISVRRNSNKQMEYSR